MHLKGHGLLVLVALILCSSSCGIPYTIYSAVTPERVVKSPDSTIASGYIPDAVYRLRQPVFLVKRPNKIVGDFPQFMLVPPGGWVRGLNLPDSVTEYASDPSKYPAVVAVLPAGERMQFRKIIWVRTHHSEPVVLYVLHDLVEPGSDITEPHPLFELAGGGIGVRWVDGSAISSGSDPANDYLDHSVGDMTLEGPATMP
jgi:hypothetical protein